VGKEWFAGSHLVDLGTISYTQGKTVKLTLMIKPAEEELKFVDVKSVPSFVKVTLAPVEIGRDKGKERYSLTFEVPPGSPKGIWTRGGWGTMDITTNHPQLPIINLNLDLIVQ
jgi:hypothetical protein